MSVAAVQAGLHMGSEVDGTTLTSSQGPRTIILPTWHRTVALCMRIWYIGGHCVEGS